MTDKLKYSIGLIIFIIYFVLLIIGAIGELFDIDAILNFFLFKCPGS